MGTKKEEKGKEIEHFFSQIANVNERKGKRIRRMWKKKRWGKGKLSI
jgi:hypothetical protein